MDKDAREALIHTGQVALIVGPPGILLGLTNSITATLFGFAWAGLLWAIFGTDKDKGVKTSRED